MYQIGFVRQEFMNVKDGENGVKVVKWLEMYFRIGGVVPFKAKMVQNKKKEKDNHPDFFIYLRGNLQKGDSFRDIKIGSLWLKEKQTETGVEKYMTGQMFIDWREVGIYIKKASKIRDDEKLGFLYEVYTFLDKENDNRDSGNYEENIESSYMGSSVEPTVTEIDINDQEIPF